MPYEVTCPSCHARLNVRDDVGDASLICPRCLQEVANPARQPQPAAAAPANVFAWDTHVQRTVPSVPSESKRSVGCGYWVVLAFTALGIAGLLLAWAFPRTRGGESDWLKLLMLLEVVLTILILYPIGLGLFRATAPRARASPGSAALRTVGIFAVLLALTPLAFIIIFLSICAVCVAVGGHR